MRFDFEFYLWVDRPKYQMYLVFVHNSFKELGIILTTKEEGETSAIDQKLLKSRSIRLIITIKDQNKETKTKTTIIGDKLLESDRHSSLSECFDVIHLSRE